MSDSQAGGLGQVRNGRLAVIERLALVAVFLFVSVFTYAYNSKVAGGADSWGYMAEAVRLSHFRFYEPERVYSPFGQQEDARLSHPLGLVSKGTQGTVPYYPMGFPLLMVPFLWLFGLKGAFWVTPLLAAGAIVLTYRLGRALLDPAAAALGAVLLCVFPNFLFSAFNPMSDIPATFFVALTLVALMALPRSTLNDVLLGFSLGVGVWIRPNLALIAAMVVIWLALRREWGRLVRVGLVFVPFVLIQAGVNLHLYGVPWRTGYGGPAWGVPLAAALARAGRYLGRLHAQQAGVGLFLLGASLVFNRLSLAVRALLFGVFAALLVFFAFYRIDNQWWYFRFLLPAIPAVTVLEAGFVTRLLEGERFRKPRQALMVALAVVFAVLSFSISKNYGLFRLAGDEQKYVRAAEMTRNLVKPPAVILAKQHSGSLRYYTGLATTRYDISLGDQLGRLRAVEAAGGRVYLLVEDWEINELRARYSDFDALFKPLGTVEPNRVTLFEAAPGWSLALREKEKPGAAAGRSGPRKDRRRRPGRGGSIGPLPQGALD